jgi:DHA3 family macrolide efflux protein-like MFS transporter
MRNGGWAARMFGWMAGAGPGSGMAVMMAIAGVLTILTLMSGYVFPVIRNMERDLPDHDQLQKVDEAA